MATRTPTLLGPNYPSEPQGHVFSPDGERLITAGASPKEIGRVWDVNSGRCLMTLPGELGKFYARLGFSPDGNTLFAASLVRVRLHPLSAARMGENPDGHGILARISR